jgi:predicted lipoprotein
VNRVDNRARRPHLACLVALVALTALTALSGCSSGDDDGAGGPDPVASPTASPVDREEVLGAVADDVIVPAYLALGEKLAGFESAVATLCGTPGGPGLESARTAWRDALDAWETTTPIGIGPSMEHRLMSAVAFAARPTAIERLLAGDRGVDPGSVEPEGAAVHGLFAAEHVLFSDQSSTLTTPDGSRRCEYLHSVAVLTNQAAETVVGEWADGPARDRFAAAVGSEADDSLPALLNEVTHRVKAIDEKSLRDVAAAESYESLAEGRRDGPGAVGLARQQAALRSAVAVIGSGSAGIAPLVRERSPETADRLEERAVSAMAAVDALPPSVAAVWQDAETVQLAHDAAEEVAALKVLLVTEVASQLGVTITLSDGDGDA